jgi:hypothetical protein
MFMDRTIHLPSGVQPLIKLHGHAAGRPASLTLVYMLRSEGQLVGIMGVHVDDTALGGEGQVFRNSAATLRARFILQEVVSKFR